MSMTLAFDVYGTLIDPLGISEALEESLGDGAARFAAAWREKQIEYLFRRGLGGDYEPFGICTAQAFDHTCLQLKEKFAPGVRNRILGKYTELPAYAGTTDALQQLRHAGFRCFAFSNGEPGDLETLLTNAGLRDSLEGIVSVHTTRSYKPDPDVYAHFLQAAQSAASGTWLVSGNPFDIIGAHNAGWNTAWLQRDPAQVFDPWGVTPHATISALAELEEVLPRRPG